LPQNWHTSLSGWAGSGSDGGAGASFTAGAWISEPQ